MNTDKHTVTLSATDYLELFACQERVKEFGTLQIITALKEAGAAIASAQVTDDEPAVYKKKSIDLSDGNFDKIRRGQNENLQKLYDPETTEPTMQLRLQSRIRVTDALDLTADGVNVLQQYHRYLHKEGGEWRDVPTV